MEKVFYPNIFTYKKEASNNQIAWAPEIAMI